MSGETGGAVAVAGAGAGAGGVAERGELLLNVRARCGWRGDGLLRFIGHDGVLSPAVVRRADEETEKTLEHGNAPVGDDDWVTLQRTNTRTRWNAGTR